MPATPSRLILKNCGLAGLPIVASYLEHGELALNYGDGRMYFKMLDNSVKTFVTPEVMRTSPGTWIQSQTFSAPTTFSNNVTIGATGSTTINNPVYLNGPSVSIDGSLDVGGNVSFSGTSVTIADTTALTVEGTSSFTGDVTANNIEVGGVLTVAGQASFEGELDFAEESRFNGTIRITRSFNVVKAFGSPGATISWDLAEGHYAIATLTQNATLANPANVRPGSYTIKIIQGGSGNYTLALGSNFKTPAGAAVDLGTAVGSITILTFTNYGDNAHLYLTSQKNFA